LYLQVPFDVVEYTPANITKAERITLTIDTALLTVKIKKRIRSMKLGVKCTNAAEIRRTHDLKTMEGEVLTYTNDGTTSLHILLMLENVLILASH
jgi:hypothetical protein